MDQDGNQYPSPRFMTDNTIVALAMHCWMNMSAYPYNRQHALSAIHMILTEAQPADLRGKKPRLSRESSSIFIGPHARAK